MHPGMMGQPMMYPGMGQPGPYGMMPGRPGSASDNASVGSAGSNPGPTPGMMASPGGGPMNQQQMGGRPPMYPTMPMAYYGYPYMQGGAGMGMPNGMPQGPNSVSGSDDGSNVSPNASPGMGPMAQPFMYPRGPQFVYYPQSGMGGPGMGNAPPPHLQQQQQQQQQQSSAPPPRKEKKILEIIDPKTKKAVLPSPTHKEASSAASTSSASSAAAAAPAAAPASNASSTAASGQASNGSGAAAAAPAPAAPAASKPGPRSNIMLEALQRKLQQEAAEAGNSAEADSAAAADRQRKEAEAKAQLEEQQRVADEKRKKLQEDEERAEKERKEADLKRKAEQAEEERKKREQELVRQQEVDAAAKARALAEGSARSTPAAGSSSSSASQSPSAATAAAPEATAPANNADEQTDSAPAEITPVQVKRNESGKIIYEYAELMGFKTRYRDTPQELTAIDFKIVSVRPPLARGASGGMGGSRRGFDGGNPREQRPGGPPGAHELEATIKKVNGILNKLTLEKFDRLSKQMLEIPMKSVKMLKETMAAIFDKALSESKFGELYADLCRVIVESKGKNHQWDFVETKERDGKYYFTASDDENEPDETRLVGPYDSEEKALEMAAKMTDFKRILLNKCQEEFEKETQIQESEALVEEMKNLYMNETDKAKKAEAQIKYSDAKYESLKIKRKVLGNIQFIGELFKKKILTEKVMHSCIIKILNPKQEIPEEEDLECLCRLLTTIGSTLDSSPVPRTKQLVDEYFAKLRRIAGNKDLDARYRFMIMDVIELRENKWQARREELKAKKIEDVHKDAAREEQEKARQTARGGGARGAPPARGGGSFGRDRGSARGNFSNAASNGPMIQQVAKGSAMGSSQGYKIGGGGGGAAKVGGARPAGGAALGGGGLRAGAGSMRPGGAAGSFRPGASAGAGLQKPPALGGAGRASGRFAPGRMGGSGPLRPGAGGQGAPAGQSAQPAKRKVPAIDTETMENKVRGALEEYVHLNMTSELSESFKELIPQVESEEELKLFVIKQACYMIVEKKDAERRHIPDALVHLHKEMSFLTHDDFVAGLDARFEFMADESMDSPLCVQHYGTLLAHLFVEDVLKLADFPAFTEKMKEESNHIIGMLFKKTIAALKEHEKGPKVLEEQKDSIPKDFVSEYKLEETLA
ncbi:Eukaryotic translation initiation factor 4G [Hondaea fermentalgiana]|uniref:Eukaryotic translation initiation factor 4G n=1 Tax=Hondaea fermentalgiana TaxID=2315210 RepID=A0A2R5GIJ5_9STRA|nr:Eukaryotic translation initiation factor 4G [Hondaea fermentalgiana]|eukprot:GBG27694.1 Eukaryotic translation initiation factor 4G [Hondaea fermentalgiana]